MGDVDLDDPNWERRDYDKFVAYGASKTANILHMVELDRRLRDAACGPTRCIPAWSRPHWPAT